MLKYFYLPGYYIFYNEFVVLDEYKKDHPDYFLPDRIIAGAYDLPLGLKWNGGRGSLAVNKTVDWQEIANVISYYQNKENFSLLHTCSNNLLTSMLINDYNCNKFITTYYRTQDKIIIADPKLKSHLEHILKNPSFIYSTTLNIIDIDQVNQLSKDNIYVLYYGKNNDDEYLKRLKHPQNIEILCAELCIPNCPNRLEHYKDESAMQLGRQSKFSCPYNLVQTESILNRIDNTPHMVNNQRIEEQWRIFLKTFLSKNNINQIFEFYNKFPKITI